MEATLKERASTLSALHLAVVDAGAQYESFVRDLFSSLTCDASDELQVATCILLLRVLEFHASSIDLLREGRITVARVVVRSTYEAAMTARAITKSSEVFDRWKKQADKSRAKALKSWANLEAPQYADLREYASTLPLEELSAVAKGPRLTVRDMADAAEMSESYQVVYGSLSESVHSSVLELYRHAILDEDGSLVGLRPTQETSETALVSSICTNMLWATADAVYRARQESPPAALEGRMRTVRDMADALSKS